MTGTAHPPRVARSAQPLRQIRALYDATTITVYQAYSPAIADAALRAGAFVPPFKEERMTWIKPSFLWMMYRSGWGTKPGQERTLAVRITREGFEAALADACLSHFDPDVHSTRQAWSAAVAACPNRIQWDPERNVSGDPLAHRSIQIGIGPARVGAYAHEWVVGISDVSDLVEALRLAPARLGELGPRERPYPLPAGLAQRIGASGPF